MTAWFFKFPHTPSLGGGEFFSLLIAEFLRKRGYTVRLITSDQRLLRLFEKHGLPRRRASLGFEPVSTGRLLLWLLTWGLAKLRARRWIHEIKPGDAVFLHSITEKLLLTRPAKRRGADVYWLEYKIPGKWLRQNPLLRRYRRLAKRATLITTSKFARDAFRKIGVAPENVAFLYPAAETAPAPYPNNFTIGVLSRLDPEKGTKEFLRLMMPLLKNHPAWQLLIAGAGQEENAIKQIASTSKQVRFLGLISDRREFFAEISVLAYPTQAEETFGLSLLEAQSSGRAVVANRRGAIPEAVAAGESGLLIPPSGPALWAEALEKLSKREVFLAMSDAALKQAGRFSTTNFEQGLWNLMAAFKTDRQSLSPGGT